jgi:hypothetical protein
MAYRAVGRLVPRDAWQLEAAALLRAETDAFLGELVVYGSDEKADHIGFWLGRGTILHATAREGLGVVEEPEPAELRPRRRRVIRL